MLVRMKAEVSGDRNGEPWPKRGRTIDIPDDEAVSLLYSGIVEEVDDDAPVEAAVMPSGDVEAAVPQTSPMTKASSGLHGPPREEPARSTSRPAKKA